MVYHFFRNIFSLFRFQAPDIPQEEKRTLKEAHEACNADPYTYVDEDLLRKLRVHRDNVQVQIHMFCMAEKAGLLTADGRFNENIIKRKIGYLIKGKDAVDEVYRKCSTEKRTKEETVTYLWLCLLVEGTEYYHKL